MSRRLARQLIPRVLARESGQNSGNIGIYGMQVGETTRLRTEDKLFLPNTGLVNAVKYDVFSGLPGVCLLSNVLTEAECDTLINFSERCGYTQDTPVSLGRDVRQNDACVFIAEADLNGMLCLHMISHSRISACEEIVRYSLVKVSDPNSNPPYPIYPFVVFIQLQKMLYFNDVASIYHAMCRAWRRVPTLPCEWGASTDSTADGACTVTRSQIPSACTATADGPTLAFVNEPGVYSDPLMVGRSVHQLISCWLVGWLVGPLVSWLVD